MQYAQDTQHEKILRGLAVGIALTMYGRMEEADALIESLQRDKDPILRWAGMYTLAMAYCGSGNNQAIRSLLHVAVSRCWLSPPFLLLHVQGLVAICQKRVSLTAGGMET